jgi:asparagine N-glycosylation enzyme membrane subunit Stt3
MSGIDWTLALPLALPLALTLAGGIAVGLLFFHSLRWVTSGYLQGQALRAAILQAARLALLVGAMVLLVRLGALVLLVFAAGLVAARWWVVRRERRSLS